jgi:hypothetical protein
MIIALFLCAGTTAIRPITKTVQKHKKNTPIQVTKENTRKRGNKKSHLKLK